MTDYEALSRAYDVYLIKNVMGRHAYYDALGIQHAELDELWSCRDDISWGNNQGFWIGRDALYNYYAEAGERKNDVARERMANTKQCIEAECIKRHQGELWMHSLTTPLTHVAGDGQTAQGMWYSLGQVTNAINSGNIVGTWKHERYAVDFIKENGQWKIWHFFAGTDLSCEAGTPFTGSKISPPAVEAVQKVAVHKTTEVPPNPTIPMELYHCKYGWHNEPHFPKPYETHTPEISYGPEKYM